MAYKGKLAGLINRPGYNSALKNVVPPSKLPVNRKFLSSEADQPVKEPISEPSTSAIDWLTPRVKSQLREQDVTLKYNLDPQENAIRADVYKFEPSEPKNIFQNEKKSVQEWFSNPITQQRYYEQAQGFLGNKAPSISEITNRIYSVGGNKQNFTDFGEGASITNIRDPKTGNITGGIVNYDSNTTPSEIKHEIMHATNVDQFLGPALRSVLGSTYSQVKNPNRMTKRDPKSYLNDPHEMYGKFFEFRDLLNYKPGEQIDEQELLKRVKNKKLESHIMFTTFDNENLVNALNTIASSSNLKEKSNNLNIS